MLELLIYILEECRDVILPVPVNQIITLVIRALSIGLGCRPRCVGSYACQALGSRPFHMVPCNALTVPLRHRAKPRCSVAKLKPYRLLGRLQMHCVYFPRPRGRHSDYMGQMLR